MEVQMILTLWPPLGVMPAAAGGLEPGKSRAWQEDDADHRGSEGGGGGRGGGGVVREALRALDRADAPNRELPPLATSLQTWPAPWRR